jgi:hypothetical protein
MKIADITINHLYYRLGLSPKSRASWLRRINKNLFCSIGQDLSKNPYVSYETWLEYIKPYTKGNHNQVNEYWFPVKSEQTPNKELKDSKEVKEENAENFLVDILREISIAIISTGNDIISFRKEINSLKEIVEVQGQCILDLRTIIANKKINPDDTIRDQIIGQINYLWGRSGGRYSQKELYDSMYSQYCEQYNKDFIKSFYDYRKINPSPKISKLEYAERMGQHVMMRLLKIAKTMSIY